MIYFVSGDGRVALGPYLDWEIQPQLRARAKLGWPDYDVYRITASSQWDAQDKVQSKIRRER